MPEARKIIFNIKNNMRAPTPSSDSKPKPHRTQKRSRIDRGSDRSTGDLRYPCRLYFIGSRRIPSPFADAMEFQARFANIKDLREGDPVKMAGMTIGQGRFDDLG